MEGGRRGFVLSGDVVAALLGKGVFRCGAWMCANGLVGFAEAECCYGADVGQGSQDGGGGPEDEGREGEEDAVKCVMCHC